MKRVLRLTKLQIEFADMFGKLGSEFQERHAGKLFDLLISRTCGIFSRRNSLFDCGLFQERIEKAFPERKTFGEQQKEILNEVETNLNK